MPLNETWVQSFIDDDGIFLIRYVGDSRSNQIGVFTGSIMILVIASALVLWICASRTGDLLMVGLVCPDFRVRSHEQEFSFRCGRRAIDYDHDHRGYVFEAVQFA